MQNTNELRSIITIGDQHTNSNSDSQAPHQFGQMENDVFKMVLGNGQKGETLQNGYSADRLFNSQNDQIFVEENMTRSQIIDHHIKKTDELLDDICLSDDEETEKNDKVNKQNMLTQSEYNNEMKKISELYEEDESMNKYTGTRNEQDVRKEIPMPFDLTNEDVLVEAGMVEDIFEDKIIIRANIFNGILDLDNILFNENKFAVGYLDDVIGKVESPYYVVKFFPNFTEESRQKINLIPGKSIFFPKEKSTQVLARNLMKSKGCDASNAFDEEVVEDEMEFSDDEEEVKFKSRRKSRKQSQNIDGMKVDPEDGPRFNFNEKANSKKQKVSLEEYYGYEGSLGVNKSSINNKVTYNMQGTGNSNNIQMQSNNISTMSQMGNPGNAMFSSEYKLNNQGGMNNNINNMFNPSQFPNPQQGLPFNMGMPNNNMNNFNMLNLMMMSMGNQVNPMTNTMANPMANPMQNNMSYNPMMQNFNIPQNTINNVNPQYPIKNSSNFPSVNPFQPPSFKK